MFRPYFTCSEVAALVGKSPYRSRHQAILVSLFKEAKRPRTGLPRHVVEALLTNEQVHYIVGLVAQDETVQKYVPAFQDEETADAAVAEASARVQKKAEAAKVIEEESIAVAVQAQAVAEAIAASTATSTASSTAASTAAGTSTSTAAGTTAGTAAGTTAGTAAGTAGIATGSPAIALRAATEEASRARATAVEASMKRAETVSDARILLEAAAGGLKVLQAAAQTKKRGREEEAGDLDALAKRRSLAVTERNTEMVFKTLGLCRIGGRCDGRLPDGTIVESKHRRRMWPSVPEYDIIQLRAYLELYDAPRGLLVERFPDGSTRETPVERAASEWAPIQDALDTTARIMRSINSEDSLLAHIENCS
jgi:hypothetical protein